MPTPSTTADEATSENQMAEKALLHVESLDDWLFHGYAADLARCMHFIQTGVPARNKYVETSAAMQLITKRWSPEHEAAIGTLFRAYVASGEIGLGTPMKVTKAGTISWEHHGKHPLEVAVRVRNRPATLLLVELGALDHTDFRTIDAENGHVALDKSVDKSSPDGQPGSPPAIAAFRAFAMETWQGLDHVHAQIAEALMKRQITKSMAEADPLSPITESAPRRRNRAL